MEKLHMVAKEKHVNAYGKTLFGSQVVIDKYFNQQGRNPYSYVQCDMGKAYIYYHLVRAVMFQMVQNYHRQKGGKLVHQNSKTHVLVEIQYVIQDVKDE
jgi:hypothetical protein